MTKEEMDILEYKIIRAIQISIKALVVADVDDYYYLTDKTDLRTPDNIVDSMPVCYAKGYLKCIVHHSSDADIYKLHDLEKTVLEHDIWLI